MLPAAALRRCAVRVATAPTRALLSTDPFRDFTPPAGGPPTGTEDFAPFKHMQFRSDGTAEFESLLDRYGRSTLDTPLKGASFVGEKYSHHRNIVPLDDGEPNISVDAFVSPCSVVSGRVAIGPYSSVWYSCVVRGDVQPVTVGAFTNIQDHTTIGPDTLNTSQSMSDETTIGNYVTIGHSVKISSSTIHDKCLIGMGATLMGGSIVESECIIAPNAVVPRGMRIPSGQLWGGRPARFLRNLTTAEKEFMTKSAENYHELADEHKDEFYLPFSPAAYMDMEIIKREERMAAAAQKKEMELQASAHKAEVEAYLKSKSSA